MQPAITRGETLNLVEGGETSRKGRRHTLGTRRRREASGYYTWQLLIPSDQSDRSLMCPWPARMYAAFRWWQLVATRSCSPLTRESVIPCTKLVSVIKSEQRLVPVHVGKPHKLIDVLSRGGKESRDTGYLQYRHFGSWPTRTNDIPLLTSPILIKYRCKRSVLNFLVFEKSRQKKLKWKRKLDITRVYRLANQLL